MTGRQLHLGVFIYPGGHHIAAWRHPSMQAERITELGYDRECAQIAERGKFDMVFVGDALNAREREGRVMGQVAINNLDPVSIVSAVAGVTERIGLGESALTPAAHSIMADTFPERQRAKVIAIYFNSGQATRGHCLAEAACRRRGTPAASIDIGSTTRLQQPARR
jgi:hypothetical protein